MSITSLQDTDIELLAQQFSLNINPTRPMTQAASNPAAVMDNFEFHLEFAEPQKEEVQYLKAYMSAFNNVAGACILDATGEIKYANDRFCQTRGYTKTELIGTKHLFLSRAFNDQSSEHAQMLATLSAGKLWHGQIDNLNKAGERYWVNIAIVPIADNAGHITQYIAFSYEITEQVLSRKKLEDRYESSQETLQSIFTFSGSDWYWEQDASYRFTLVRGNDVEAEKLIGKARWDICGHHESDMLDWDAHKKNLVTRQVFFGFEHPIRLQHECVWVSVSGEPVYKDREFVGYRGICKDITVRRLQQDRFWELTHIHHLTQLPNKNHFKTLLDRRTVSASTFSIPFALARIDLDDFESLNATFGSAAGDMHLQLVTQRIKNMLHDGDELGHMEKNEFALMLVGIDNQEEARARLDAIFANVNQLFEDVQQRICKISCGISLYSRDGHTPDHLIRTAEVALKLSKVDGPGRYVFFERQMLTNIQRYRTLVNAVHESIDEDQLLLRYQPIIDISTGKVSSLEALMFCMHPTKGLITAAQMIETLDDASMAAKIGKVVVEKALKQAAEWKLAKVPFGKVSVNVTTADFTDGDVVNRISDGLLKYRIRPQEFLVELTEKIFLGEKAPIVMDGIAALRDLGVEIALDDFGTGYQQMMHLDLADRWKVDKQHINNIDTDPTKLELVKTLISLGEKLKKEVVIEGVETLEQLDILKAEGARFIQGFLFSPPILAAEVSTFLMHFDASRTLACQRAGGR